MTEAEWLRREALGLMVEFLREKISRRKCGSGPSD
jgi:hypothetical protein